MNTIQTNLPGDFPQRKIKDIVAENFHAVELFEKYKIDFCCKGNRSVQEALDEKKLSIPKFYKELSNVYQSNSAEKHNYNEWDLVELYEYIVRTHHTYVKSAIPLITLHIEKVINAHAKKYPFLLEVQHVFGLVANEMNGHMMKEENILFPLIKYLVDTQKFNEKPKTGGFGTIKNPIRQMEAEHVSAGGATEKLRELTDDYQLPEDACATFQVLYKELNEFEIDLHKHVHLENNILFPKAIKLEEKLLTN